MLGYISSTRRKACRQCVKAKRRCDLGYPCCKRCFTKSLDCAYPNASVREAGVVIRQTTPDLVPLGGATAVCSEPLPAQTELPELDPMLLHSSESSSSPESDDVGSELIQEGDSYRMRIGNGGDLSIPKLLLPAIWAPGYLRDDQVVFLIGRLCAFVPALAYAGHNAYIHENLYSTHQPSAYQDSCALSALYSCKTKRNIPILTKSIEDKISTLIAASHGWNLTDHLAAVQALIAYQTIRLFDPDLGQQEQADCHNRLLGLWTAHLWKRSFNEPATFKTCWEAWIFYESLRRTVLISVFLRGGWSCVTRGGLCDQIPVLARLPLTKDDKLWSADEQGFQNRLPCGQTESLVAYGDWSAGWQPAGDDPEALSEFQRMLMVACRGQDDERLFY